MIIRMNRTAQSNTGEEITLSTDPAIEGFDILAGQTWIYPTNYTLRDYQFDIIQKALLNNTLVSLPTGLGKTFIAAVVMYNFYRWYPRGTIIFMAPTRPLVKQQIDACYNIMSIPKEVTAELTGTKAQISRKEIWKEKRVFFITPQVLQNDLSILTELAGKIKCLVFDEAHKAKGNHAYCEVIRRLVPHNKYFRVLGLSATPGNTLNDVLEVINNLLISHIEIRTDESPDVVPYVFQRSLETIVVPLGGKLQDVKDSYINILEKYTRVLVRHKIIHGNCSTLTKGKIFMTLKEYKERNRGSRDGASSEIMKSLNICITLYHGYELLTRHGLRVFLSFFEEHSDKPLLRSNTDLLAIMKDLQEYLGPAPNIVSLPDGSIQEIATCYNFGHPKFYTLRDILSEHFTKFKEAESRVIVFSEYRESVMEINAILLQHSPLIRPRIFVGQSGITQRQQINVIRAFKSGECNTLISTSIGEEGLDVGEVDLIVCFDINNKSPVRMVQRMGRTGRKREGRVVVLVTEGKEQQTLKECLIHKQNLNNHILQSSALKNGMYANNPRMIPDNIEPQCRKIFITVEKDSNSSDSSSLTKRKSSTIKDMFNKIAKLSEESQLSSTDDIIMMDFEERLPQRREFWNKANPLSINNPTCRIDFSKNITKLRTLQPTGSICHSKSSELLVSMLQFADSKRYNISTTQVPVLSQPSQSQARQSSLIKTIKNFKQSDIRNMFYKPPSYSQFMQSDIGVLEEKTATSTNDIDLLYTEIIISLGTSKFDQNFDSCKLSANLFDRSYYSIINMNVEIKSWTELNSSTFDCLTIDNLNSFKTLLDQNENVQELPEASICEEIKPVYSNDENMNSSKDVLVVNKFAELKNTPFKAPSNINNILNKCSILSNLDDSIFNNISFTQLENAAPISSTPSQKVQPNIECTFDMQSFEAAEFTQLKKKSCDEEKTLGFFNLTSLEELFDDSNSKEKSPQSQDTIIYSPNLPTIPEATSSSPIISSYKRIHNSKRKVVQKRLFETSKCENEIDQIENSLVQKTINEKEQTDNSLVQKTFKEKAKIENSLVLQKTLNAEIDVSEDIFDESFVKSPKKTPRKALDVSDEDIFEDYDLFIKPNVRTNVECVNQKKDVDISINECVDLSFFGLHSAEKSPHKEQPEASPGITNTVLVQECSTSQIKNINNDCLDLLSIRLKSQEKTPQKQQTRIYIKTPPGKYLSRELVEECTTALNDFCDETFLNLFFDTSVTKPSNENNTVKPRSDLDIQKEQLIKNNAKVGSSKTSLLRLSKKKVTNMDEEEDVGDFEYLEESPILSNRQSNSSYKSQPYQANTITLIASPEKSPILNKSQFNDSISKRSQKNKPSILSLEESPVLNKSQVNRSRLTQRTQPNKPAILNSEKSPILNRSQLNCSNLSQAYANKTANINLGTKVSQQAPRTLAFVEPKQKPSLRLSTKLNRNASAGIGWYKKGNSAKQGVSNNKVVSAANRRPSASINLDDSDDDFEIPVRVIAKPSVVKSNDKLCKKNEKNDRRNKKKASNCDYLDVEAEMSIDGNASFDTSIEISDDEFEASFVDDETQNLVDNTMMQAHYLQSVKNTHFNEGKFKIPNKPLKPIAEVLSQPIIDLVDDTYVNDSFCVSSQSTEDFHNTELSELELAELILDDKRKRKKQKNVPEVPRKKQRLIIISSSDSE